MQQNGNSHLISQGFRTRFLFVPAHIPTYICIIFVCMLACSSHLFTYDRAPLGMRNIKYPLRADTVNIHRKEARKMQK